MDKQDPLYYTLNQITPSCHFLLRLCLRTSVGAKMVEQVTEHILFIPVIPSKRRAHAGRFFHSDGPPPSDQMPALLMEWTPPSGGIAMCHVGGVVNAKRGKGHPWNGLA